MCITRKANGRNFEDFIFNCAYVINLVAYPLIKLLEINR
jgi:hypothetical protein